MCWIASFLRINNPVESKAHSDIHTRQTLGEFWWLVMLDTDASISRQFCTQCPLSWDSPCRALMSPSLHSSTHSRLKLHLSFPFCPFPSHHAWLAALPMTDAQHQHPCLTCVCQLWPQAFCLIYSLQYRIQTVNRTYIFSLVTLNSPVLTESEV